MMTAMWQKNITHLVLTVKTCCSEIKANNEGKTRPLVMTCTEHSRKLAQRYMHVVKW